MSDGREYEIQTIDRLIATINSGDTCEKATKALRDLVTEGAEVVAEHGGTVKGSITITLGFTFDAKGLDVTMKHKATMPPGRKVTVPEMFLIRIPVFEGGPRHLMPVRLQYRKDGTRAKWKAELVDAAGLVRAAVRAIVSEVKEKTEAPLYLAQNPVAR